MKHRVLDTRRSFLEVTGKTMVAVSCCLSCRNASAATGRKIDEQKIKLVAPCGVYCGHFDLPVDVNIETVRVYLETDVPAPEVAASIKVNGKYTAGFIGKPCRLEITEHLKPGRNDIILEPFAPKTVQAVFYAE